MVFSMRRTKILAGLSVFFLLVGYGDRSQAQDFKVGVRVDPKIKALVNPFNAKKGYIRKKGVRKQYKAIYPKLSLEDKILSRHYHELMIKDSSYLMYMLTSALPEFLLPGYLQKESIYDVIVKKIDPILAKVTLGCPAAENGRFPTRREIVCRIPIAHNELIQEILNRISLPEKKVLLAFLNPAGSKKLPIPPAKTENEIDKLLNKRIYSDILNSVNTITHFDYKNLDVYYPIDEPKGTLVQRYQQMLTHIIPRPIPTQDGTKNSAGTKHRIHKTDISV